MKPTFRQSFFTLILALAAWPPRGAAAAPPPEQSGGIHVSVGQQFNYSGTVSIGDSSGSGQRRAAQGAAARCACGYRARVDEPRPICGHFSSSTGRCGRAPFSQASSPIQPLCRAGAAGRDLIVRPQCRSCPGGPAPASTDRDGRQACAGLSAKRRVRRRAIDIRLQGPRAAHQLLRLLVRAVQ